MGSAIIIRLYSVFRREGTAGFIKLVNIRLKKTILRLLMGPIAIPIAVCILAIAPFIRIRLIRLYSNRIGHYAWNTEYWLCMLDIIGSEKNCKTLYYTVAGHPVCNTQLHRMWKREIFILPFPNIMDEANRYLKKYGGKKYRNDQLKKYYEVQDIDRWNLLGNIKKCHISFTLAEEHKGKTLMNELGIPDGARYVCLLGRDPRYLNVIKPGVDNSYHNHRNVNINNFQKAAKMLANKGYYVIRMGKYVQDPFNVDDSRVIDYANTKFRSDFLDIYLSAHCFFFMSVGTGIESVAQVFRKPVLITNFTLSDLGILPDWKIFITKKILDVKTNKILSFREIYQTFSKLGQEKVRKQAQESGLIYIENTEDEIVEAVEEMERRLAGNWGYTEEDEQRQQQFWQDFPYRDTDYTPKLTLPLFRYGNGSEHIRIGSVFLRKNLELLH